MYVHRIPATQTDRPHLAKSLARPLHCHPTQGGEVVRLPWLARPGQLCDHRPLRVGGRHPEAFVQRQPHKQLPQSHEQQQSRVCSVTV